MNPIITDVHTSDPAVLVHDGYAYLYTGHDEAEPDADAFLMRDWLCFSSRDLLSWEAHGSPLALTDFSWAAATGAKAGTVVEHDGRFWWYVAVNHGERPARRGDRGRGRRSSDRPVPRRARRRPGHRRPHDRPLGDRRFDDDWIFFYHNGILPGGGSRRRSVCADRLFHDADGRIRRVHMTTEGLSTRRPR